MMGDSETINQKERCMTMYRDVGAQVDKILSDVDSVKIKNEKSNAHLESLKIKLSGIREQFNQEVEFLEEHAEWDTFTVAFFGETNAGKSTILESLRILFDERKRQEDLRVNMENTLPLSEKFSEDVNALRAELEGMYQRYLEQTVSVADELSIFVAQYNRDHSIKRKMVVWGSIGVLGVFLGLWAGFILFGGA